MAPESNYSILAKRASAKPNCPLRDASNQEPKSSFVLAPKLSSSFTKAEPFHFATEQRRAVYSQQLSVTQLTEERNEQVGRPLHSYPVPMSAGSAELPPKPLARHLTVPEPFEFASEDRCRRRAEFDRKVHAKLAEKELAAQQAAEEALAREEDERLQLRKATVFRARPMPDLSQDPVARPPPKPTTKAVSPRLGRPMHRRNST